MVISKQDLPLINRFNLNRSSLIEASAGTGKTFTISNLIVRLLMGAPALGNVSEKDRKSLLNRGYPLDIENILVVTFTNAAASDLRARILEKIHETRVLFEKLVALKEPSAVYAFLEEKFKGVINDPLKHLIDSYFGTLKDAMDVKTTVGAYVRLLKRAEASIDNAPISTIHSFCNKALNKIFTFEAGRAFNVELTQDTTNQEDDAKKSVFRELFYKNDILSPELLKALTGADSPSSFDDVIKKLRKVRLLDSSRGYYGYSVLFDKDSRDSAQRQDADKRLKALLSEYEKEHEAITVECAPLFQSLKAYAPRLKVYRDDKSFICDLYSNSKGKGLKKDYQEFFLGLEPLLCKENFSAEALLNLVNSNEAVITDIPDGACCRYLSYAKTVKEKDFSDYASVESFETVLQSLLESVRRHSKAISSVREEVNLLIGIRMIDRFDAICSRDGIISNDELLRQLALVLSKKDDRAKRLCSLLRNTYPVAMIDEFQDTDPVQFEIFNNLYLNEEAKKEGSVCYLIGDPKQSIYAFRGSDINSYNRAKENILKLNGFDPEDLLSRKKASGECIYDLDTNFRSGRNVIDAVNKIFTQSNDDELRGYLKKPFDYENFEGSGNSLSSNIDFDDVKASSDFSKCGRFCVKVSDRTDSLSASDDASCSFAVVNEGDDKGTYRILKGNFASNVTLDAEEKPNKENLGKACASKCAKEVYLCLTQGYFVKKNEKGAECATRVKPKDIAILVSDKKQNEQIRAALDSYGIKSVYLSDAESVLSNYSGAYGTEQKLCPSQASIDMLYLMEAILEPTSVKNALRLLGSNLLLLTREDFRSYYESEENLNKEMVLLKECLRKWSEFGFMPAFYHYLKAHKCFNRILSLENGDRVLTDYNHIAEIMQGVNSKVKGLNSQLLWFKEVLSNQEKLNSVGGDTLKRLESEIDLVKVVTVHKSKGLQYPLVFVPFLYTRQKVFDFTKEEVAFAALSTDLKEKAKEAHASFVSEAMTLAKKALCQNDYETLSSIYRISKNQEQVRLLYVALTRAQAGNFIFFNSVPLKKDARYDDSALKRVISNSVQPEVKKAFDTHKEFFEKSEDVFAENDPYEGSYRQFLLKTEVKKEGLSYGYDSLEKSIDRSFKVTSYTAIASGHGTIEGLKDDEGNDSPGIEPLEEKNEPQMLPQFTFTNGANIGTFLHKLLEIILSYKKEERDTFEKLCALIHNAMVYDYYHVISSTRGEDPVALVCSWMNEVLNTPLPYKGVCLNELENTDSLKELDYFIPVNNFNENVFNEICEEFFEDIKACYSDIAVLERIKIPRVKFDEFEGFIKGSIDLVARFKNEKGIEQYYLIDYKSNNLGSSLKDYSKENTIISFIEHKYYVQVLLYTLALHRFLSVARKDYDYDKDIGSVMYLFLRGMDSKNKNYEGIFNIRPRFSLIEKLSNHIASQKELKNA